LSSPARKRVEQLSSIEEISVDLNVPFPFVGDLRFLRDGGHRAGWLAGTAINALARIDIELLGFIKPRFVRRRMDTVYGANIDA
jgi:hypothetical protein